MRLCVALLLAFLPIVAQGRPGGPFNASWLSWAAPMLPKCGPECLPLGWGGGWGSFGAMGQVWGNHFQVFFLSACAETQAGALPKGGDRGN